MCLKEFGLRAQNLLTILGSIFSIIGGGGGLHVYSLQFENEKDIHMISKIYERMGTDTIWIC